MSKARRFAMWAVFAATLPALSGCLLAAAAAGTGATVWYVKGDLEGRVQATPQEVASATTAALDDLEIHIISQAATSIDGQVTGRTATDKKVTVTIKEAAEGFSQVSVRVGVFGDEQLGAAIFERIRLRLEEGHQPPRLAAQPH